LSASHSKRGAVTFLDVLGWKGIWNRFNNPIALLEALINEGKNEIEQSRMGVDQPLPTRILSISDTIVLLTEAGEEHQHRALDVHGRICAVLLGESIVRGIPIRGSTGYGQYQHTNNIYAGQAVDEVAAWHEMSEWVGVHMSPSAQLSFDVGRSGVWVDYEVPLKRGSAKRHKTPAVDWPRHFRRAMRREDLQQHLARLGPIFPEFSAKIFNTLTFYDAMSESATAPTQNNSV